MPDRADGIGINGNTMGNWEFLIQKEGDTLWLTLESPSVEILEGCYQLMANSSYPDTEIMIQTCQTVIEDGIPYRYCQQQSQLTNSNGRVEVMPFTYLGPGLWTLACRLPTNSNELDAELPLLQLQVLPQVELYADWETHNPEDLSLDSESESILTPPDNQIDSQAIPVRPEQDHPLSNFFESMGMEKFFSPDLLDPAFLFSVPTDVPPSTGESIQPIIPHQEAENFWTPVFSSLELTPALFESPTQLASLVILDQSAYTVIAGQNLLLSGQVQAPGALLIQIKDPLNQQVLLEKTFSLSEQTVPIPFSYDLELPVEARVLSGEVKLLTVDTKPGDIRNSQAFMVTIIASESNSAAEPVAIPPRRAFKSSVGKPLELPIFDTQAPLLPLQPCTGPSLPPQLYPNPPYKKPTRPPALPSFVITETTAGDEQLVAAGAVKPDPETGLDFETLELSKRFWLRLNSLAHEVDLLPNEDSLSGLSPRSQLSAQMFLQLLDRSVLHPLPRPTLLLPERDLKAGAPLTVAIRLPDTADQLCVKLWVEDHQRQTLIVSPRWLVDFNFNSQQEVLEASTQLSLPSDCQEAEFFAIAVDLNTEQESLPFSVIRSVYQG